MNEKLKFEILQLCSGHYLSANLPNNWYELTELEQNEFLIGVKLAKLSSGAI